MMDVEVLERALLEGARKELSPSASDRMRIQSRLVGNTAWFEPAPVRRSVLRGLTHSWRGGLALGFVVGALLGFGASQGVGYAGQRFANEPVPAPATPELERASVLPSGPVAPATAVAVEQRARSAALETEPVLERHALAPHKGEGVVGRGAVAVPRAASAEEERGSTLAQELALLQRARRALNRNDALLALGIVQSLDERFPDGVLMEERAATRILSLCQLVRTEEARERGRRFLLEHPRSVYAERVRRSCAGGR